MDNIYLVGAEEVRRAAATITAAAEQMHHAALTVAEALDGHRRWADEWLARFEQAVAHLR